MKESSAVTIRNHDSEWKVILAGGGMAALGIGVALLAAQLGTALMAVGVGLGVGLAATGIGMGARHALAGLALVMAARRGELPERGVNNE